MHGQRAPASREHPQLSLREDRFPLEEVKCDQMTDKADQRDVVDDDLAPIVRYLPRWDREFAAFYAEDNVRVARFMAYWGGGCALFTSLGYLLGFLLPHEPNFEMACYKYWTQNYYATIPTLGFMVSNFCAAALLSIPRTKVLQHKRGDFLCLCYAYH